MSSRRVDPKDQFSKKLAKWSSWFWFLYMLLALAAAVIQPLAGDSSVYLAGFSSVVMILNLSAYTHNSVYDKAIAAGALAAPPQEYRTEGKPLAIEEKAADPGLVSGFLSDVRKQYSNRRIDAFVDRCFGVGDEFTTADVQIGSDEGFILFLLATLRGTEKRAPFTVQFREGNKGRGGYSLPDVLFRRKKTGERNGEFNV